MTQKNEFLKFVHNHIDEFTPQQMEQAIRLLNGKAQPTAAEQADQSRKHNLEKAERSKTQGQQVYPFLKDQLKAPENTAPVFNMDAVMQTLASMGGSNMSKNLTTHITYTNGT